MPRRPIYKHAGIIVKVKKEKEEKKGAKKTTTQQASKQFYCDPMGMRQKTNTFVPSPRKGGCFKMFQDGRRYRSNGFADLT